MMPRPRHTPIVVLLAIWFFGFLLLIGPILDVVDLARLFGFDGVVERIINDYRPWLFLLIFLIVIDWTRFILQPRGKSHNNMYDLITDFMQDRHPTAVGLILSYVGIGSVIILSVVPELLAPGPQPTPTPTTPTVVEEPSVPPTHTLTPGPTRTPTPGPTRTPTPGPTRTPTPGPTRTPTADPVRDPCRYYAIRVTSHEQGNIFSTGERTTVAGRFNATRDLPYGRLHLLIEDTTSRGEVTYWAEDNTIRLDADEGVWTGRVYVHERYRGNNSDLNIILAWFDDEVINWYKNQGIVFQGTDNDSKMESFNLRNRPGGVFVCAEVPIRIR